MEELESLKLGINGLLDKKVGSPEVTAWQERVLKIKKLMKAKSH
ncbi:hypothetical protein O1D97_06220 [Marinomonas sp. 15G1-11]|uniref:Uncharacterized protein n=2 Tax=Gammaproteobacteria TaxID=1236 RepID=A0ABT2PA69_9GAMM|nr:MULTISPECIES: hypothetical protein [Gammaproteobacteria]MCT8988660.1 hypothetical protein [Shewanella sp. KJ10-1]MCT8988670.1 hypothetical protein [Shewanella sp. KJ10-1]MCZ2721251.1 hypothetical protein [Marinomonas sp. 15G1-11]